jgi:predicted nucleotidyltransferase
MPQLRGDDGKFLEKVTINEVLELLETVNEPLTAPEIAAQLDISNRTALDKLNELNVRDPTVRRKQVGASAVIWFIQHGDVHEQAFAVFADRLTAACGEAIERIILYGSVARGEARADSDVDVLIVFEDESARDIVSEQASTLSFDILLEYDVSISLNYKTTDEMEAQQQHSYIQTVQNEGRVYGG